MISSFFARLQGKPRTIGALFSVLAVLAVVSLWRLRVDTDIFSLLPSDLPGLQEFVTTTKTFGSLDAVYGLLEAPDAARARAYADAFTREVRKSERVSSAQCGMPSATFAMRGVPPAAVLFLTDDDLRELRARLDPAGYPRALAQAKRALLSPAGSRAAAWIQRDPLGVQSVLLRGLQRLPRPSGIDAAGYWGREDGGRYRIFVYIQPTAPPGDLAFSEALVADIRAADVNARRELETQATAQESFRAGFTGAHVVSVEEARALRADLVGTPGLSLILVLAVCWLYFRRLRAIAALGVAMGVSMLLGMGLAGASLGSLNVATAGFAAVLCGLADDYAVHLYNGIRVEQSAGLAEVFRVEGRSVALGALTTAGAFLVLGTSAFPGMRQFSWLMAASTVASVFVMATLFLALAGTPREPIGRAEFRLGERWESAVWRSRWAVLIVGTLAVTALATLGLPRIRFEPNLRNLSASSDSLRAQEEILRFFGNRLEPLIFRWRGDTLSEGLSALVRLREAAPKVEEVVHVESALQFRPSPARAEAARFALAELDPSNVAQSLLAAAGEAGLRPEAFEVGVDYLKTLLEVAHLAPEDALRQSLLPEELRDTWGGRFVREVDGRVELAAYVYPAQRITSPEEGWLLAERLGADTTHWGVAGIGLLTGPLQTMLEEDLRRTTALAVLFVAAVAAIGLRSGVRAALALTPAGVACVGTAGLLGALDVPLNVVNFAAIPLIVGLGIDYGLHLVTVVWGRPDRPVGRILSETGLAITASAATTLLGFAALLPARHAALASFGALGCIGVGMSWLSALVILPPLLRFGRVGRV